MTSNSTPRVALHDHEKQPAAEEDDTEFHAEHEEIPPVLSPYAILRYGPRTQLMMLFTRTRRALPLQTVIDAVDGTPEDVVEELNYLYRLGVIQEQTTRAFVLDHSNPVAESLRDLIWSLQREADDMDPADYVTR